MKKPVCSIIVRAYNEEKHIGRLMQGILEQTIKSVQVILVDSGSTDKTREIAAQYPVEIVQIRPQDFTFGRSLNLGISHAEADLIVMASAHVYPVYPDWLETLLASFENEKMGLSYGKQRGGETTHFSEKQIFLNLYPDQSVTGQNHPFCNNANAAIRRSLWEQHAYDENLTGLEDLEWGKWAQEQGFGISYCADAEVIHVHNETLSGTFNRYKREAMAFKAIYPHENFRKRDLIRLFTQNVKSDWKEALRESVFIKNWAKIIGFRWRQFFGTYRGYQQSGPLTWQLKKTFYYPRGSSDNAAVPRRRNVKPIQYN